MTEKFKRLSEKELIDLYENDKEDYIIDYLCELSCEDVVLTQKEYELIMEGEHEVSSEERNINGKSYLITIYHINDGEFPDEMNTRILISEV